MSQATDDFIRSSGNLAFVNGYLKWMVLALLLVSLGLTCALVHRPVSYFDYDVSFHVSLVWADGSPDTVGSPR